MSMMSLYLKILSIAFNSTESPDLRFTCEAVKCWITGTVGGDMFGKQATSSNSRYLMRQREEFEVRLPSNSN